MIEDTKLEYINSLVPELHLSTNTKETYKNVLDKYSKYLENHNIKRT